MSDSRVVQVFCDNPGALATVYGIAHSGGGAAPWSSVAALADQAVEVRGIRLAGRESRVDSPHYSTVGQAAIDVAQAIYEDAHRSRRPIFLAGSCSGAVVARAAADYLTGPLRPLGLLALRQQAPSTPHAEVHPRLSAMNRSELRDWVRGQQLMPAELLDDEPLFEYFEPALRADLEITESYVHSGPPLQVPIFICNVAGGEEARSQWQRETTATVQLIDGPGHGDYLTDHPETLAREISALVEMLVKAGTMAAE